VSASVSLEAAAADGTTSAVGAIEIGSGAVRAAGGPGAATESVTFAVAPIALQDMAFGALSSIVAMSAALSLTPDRVVDIDPAVGIGVDLCIADDAAQTDGARCALLLGRLRPFSSQDVTAAGDLTEVAGGCAKGTACGCSCRFTTPHLTAFVVADGNDHVAGEISAEQIDAGLADGVAPPAPGGAAGGAAGGALPVIPLVAACAAVVLLAAGLLLKKRRSGSFLPTSSGRAPSLQQAYPQVEMSENFPHTTNPASEADDISHDAI
jgi:hypothetical protein